ncbi:hypothetical protein [Confluentibacter flavum]|uniref:Uncharacterized protein n=1 Tax=Confluentibacter flavum TaxID=1909700 RepID=A0A2N3HGX1_9FLAO|nr:hypothetical protein [Confluentibacter flavum]PKQ44201.1 hypothetical protein CSW08_13950 [Confluentibacter flavum]
MIKKLTIIGIYLLLINCASFPKIESENFQQLTEKNIAEINGIYSNFAENSEKHKHLTLSGRLTSTKLKDTISDIKIEVLNSKEIRFSFIKNQQEIESKIVKYKLQKDGFLLLKNKNFRSHGIPWIFGDYEIRKYEIGLTSSGNLIMEGVEQREGAHLMILWSPSNNYKFTDIYKKK